MKNWKPDLESYQKYQKLISLDEDDVSEKEYELWSKASDWWYEEQINSFPVPQCCDAIQNYPVVYIDCLRADDLENSLHDYEEYEIINVFWNIQSNYKPRYNLDSYNYFTKKSKQKFIGEYQTSQPKIQYCPFCSTSLPKLILKPEEERNYPIADWKIEGQCLTCNNENYNCYCYPELSAWKIEE